MIRWKVDIMAKLKAAGYTTYKLRKENLMGQQMLVKIRDGGLPSWSTIDNICEWLQCQPGDLVEHVSETEKAPDA